MAHFTDEQFESFRNAYVTTMLWSTNDESDEAGGNPLDENYSADDLSECTQDRVDAECKAFLYCVACYIEADPTAKCGPDFDLWGRAGHDFWLTRCGHGAGFWDGDWPVYGDMFTEVSKSFGNIDPYVGDDGLIYL
jgi:hypothetical protein